MNEELKKLIKGKMREVANDMMKNAGNAQAHFTKWAIGEALWLLLFVPTAVFVLVTDQVQYVREILLTENAFLLVLAVTVYAGLCHSLRDRKKVPQRLLKMREQMLDKVAALDKGENPFDGQLPPTFDL